VRVEGCRSRGASPQHLSTLAPLPLSTLAPRRSCSGKEEKIRLIRREHPEVKTFCFYTGEKIPEELVVI